MVNMNTIIYAIYIDYGGDDGTTLQGYVTDEDEAKRICKEYNRKYPSKYPSHTLEYEELAPYKPM